MPENKIIIQEAGVTYSKIFAEIFYQSFHEDTEQKWTQSDIEEIMKIQGTKGIVISYDYDPIGFSIIREAIDEAEIITFCILPKWGKNGYATMLLEWIINKLQMRSFKRLFLEVREHNDAAIRLYKKCSFTIIGRRKGYYNSSRTENEDALVMQCNLLETFNGFRERNS